MINHIISFAVTPNRKNKNMVGDVKMNEKLKPHGFNIVLKGFICMVKTINYSYFMYA